MKALIACKIILVSVVCNLDEVVKTQKYRGGKDDLYFCRHGVSKKEYLFFATSQTFSFTFQYSFQIMCCLQKLSFISLLAGAALAQSSPADDSKPSSLNKYSSPLLDSFRPSPSSRSLHPAASPLDRTIDLSTLGIDLGDIFERLLSPAGIVQQFVLTLILGSAQPIIR